MESIAGSMHEAYWMLAQQYSETWDERIGDLLRRTRDEYLEELGNLIRDLQTTPGRLNQSATASSFDAWIKQYRPDENSPNTTISYYTKGAVVGLLRVADDRHAEDGLVPAQGGGHLPGR